MYFNSRVTISKMTHGYEQHHNAPKANELPVMKEETD